MPHFSFLLYILLSVIFIAFFNLYLFFKKKNRNCIDGVLLGANVYLGIHAIYVFLIRALFYNHLYLDRFAPFALLYGPVLFFILSALLKREITYRTIFFNVLLPTIFWIGFFAMLIIGVDTSAKKIYGYALTIAVPASLFFYTAYGFYGNTLLTGKLKHYKAIIIPALVLMFFMCSLCVIVPFYRNQLAVNPNAKELLSIMVYVLMLSASSLILAYLLFGLQNQKQPAFMVAESSGIYERSALTKPQLENYKDRLDQLMNSEKTFLIAGLSLESLAKILRIPKHQLTQVFSLAVGKTFSQYINAKRIDYARDLLTSDDKMKVEEIAIKSGFGTLMSFHRQFKSAFGCTPSEYRKNQMLPKQS